MPSNTKSLPRLTFEAGSLEDLAGYFFDLAKKTKEDLPSGPTARREAMATASAYEFCASIIRDTKIKAPV